ncbi:MAG: Mur ligase family protein, partial [Anaeromyxobacteraceae bacterium]|nr:Mur ligase family protein [Anaeromyxobacteraceae bacterium]
MLDVHRYLEALSPLSMRFGLERVERALDALGRPERAAPALHVAGTNGKGSTCAMAAAALRAAGLRTGLYTSPHLVAFNERIQVDGVPIGDAALAAAVQAVRSACPWHEAGAPEERLTYFEVATLAAFVHFAAARVEVMVVEVGLGGRLDATNALRPAVAAVARIGLDHTRLLGATIAEVAREKAGIFKPGVPAVLHAVQPPGALEVLRAEAA